MNHADPNWWQRLDTLMWSNGLNDLSPWQGRLVWFARLVYALYRDATQGFLSLQAMSLVYTTLLSLVPLLAVSFSVLTAFGAHNALEPLLHHLFEPLGDQAPEVVRSMMEFVEKTRVGVLGSVGLVILIYTVIAMIQKIEQVFNNTWRVEETRPFAQRVSQYLSILLVGPVLLVTLVGLSTSARNTPFVESVLAVQPFGTLIDAGGALVPFFLIIAVFTFIYSFVPNARVQFSSALIGALTAGVLWRAVGWLFAHFMASSTKYAAIYSGLAIVILFMVWVYIAWLIVLIGASIAFYHQHPEYLTDRSQNLCLSNRLRERLALQVASYIARNFYQGVPAWTGDELARTLGVPQINVQRTLHMLEQDGLLMRGADDPPRFTPAKAPDAVTVKSLLDAVHCFEEHEGDCRGAATQPGIQAVESRIDAAITQALGVMTLRELAAALDEPRPVVREGTEDAVDEGSGAPLA
ncbi:MAG TPA: YhjD/YihY/BrkB family envelope integrity protein [Lamprocystis sp. (in: g-proteobacteria)]|nr:YhjD/YihY/BrkB family envelope integrity protein [Lamprocystis sp. (in: g-proteobacteria)]